MIIEAGAGENVKRMDSRIRCRPGPAVILPFLILLIFSFNACNFNKRSPGKKTDRLIDSLIEVKRINEKTLLITFGYDAITAVNTNKGIVVVDAGISPGLTSRYRKIIEKEFNTSAIRKVSAKDRKQSLEAVCTFAQILPPHPNGHSPAL